MTSRRSSRPPSPARRSTSFDRRQSRVIGPLRRSLPPAAVAAAGLVLALSAALPARGQPPEGAPPAARGRSSEGAQREAASSERERYLELLRKKERLERLNALWKVEAELAAK